jgi:aspartyl-tRNA(Asn)/glutamyl-tRNA(Gln) amidotransferase subunit A
MRALHRGNAGPLEGIPLAIKDMFCTAGIRSTACSHILENFVPTYESTVTSQLWRDGAVLLGKTNCDEFAMGSSNETSHFGPVHSPWRRKGSNTPLTPGGSSGGSASCGRCETVSWVLRGRIPVGRSVSLQAFTGTVRHEADLRPLLAVGHCRHLPSVASTKPGPFTRSVRDAAILLRSMAGPDEKDTTCADLPVPDYEAAVGKSVKGLRIGIPKNIASTECRRRSRKSGRAAAHG